MFGLKPIPWPGGITIGKAGTLLVCIIMGAPPVPPPIGGAYAGFIAKLLPIIPAIAPIGKAFAGAYRFRLDLTMLMAGAY